MNLQKLFRLLASLVVVFAFVGCASEAKKESTGEYFDDTVLTTKVKTALLQDPVVSGLSVNVETFKGVVQLSGFVKTSSERSQAEKVARGVAGVKQVKNDIQLR